MRSKRYVLVCAAMLIAAAAARGQEQSDNVVRVDTRVVFIDALVKDKRTDLPVMDLTRDNFRVFDNGRQRTLSYFSSEGGARRPLALVLCLNLENMGARRYLVRDDVRASIAAALRKLAPEDEVAVMAVWEAAGGKPVMAADLTRDRAKAIAALAPPQDAPEEAGAGGAVQVMDGAAQAAIEIARRRPNSQVVFVYVSDGLATIDMIDLGSRQALVTKLIEGNVNFSALTCRMPKGMAVGATIVNIPLRMLGASMTGSEQYLAKQTGGVAVKVKSPEDFGTGLQQITGGLASRYSLGFTLGEDEREDGQMHNLEVKVKARDPKGKERKLTVSARRGYYAPKKMK
jgi:VWFA-related protein